MDLPVFSLDSLFVEKHELDFAKNFRFPNARFEKYLNTQQLDLIAKSHGI